MFDYVSAMLDSLVSLCCFGNGNKEKKVFEKIKGDVKDLTERELEHLWAFLLRPVRQKACCF